MKINHLLVIVGCAGLISSCAATVPMELVNARKAYRIASTSSASRVAQAELHVAHYALSKAEHSFKQYPESYQTRDLAYVAQRKAEIAVATASIFIEQGIQSRQESDYKTVQGKIVAKTKRDLSQTRVELAASKQSGETASAQLEVEKQARMSAEAKLAGAMKDLTTIAAVKEETRGVVITLSGGVLFASGKYVLLNTAMTKLDQVAEALKAQDNDKRMVVEGHTDSQGSDNTNMPLSLNRANAVRGYLVSRGVDENKISAIGMGSNKPITDNKTSENRANNRRVEIIIERESSRTSSM